MVDKAAYFETIQGQLESWSEKIGKLKEDTKDVDESVVTQYYEQVEDLMALHELARQKLQEVKEYGDAHWDDYRKSMDQAMASLEESHEKLRSHFKI
jgi:hypothetical protein